MTQAEGLKEVFFFPLDLKPAKNTTGETVLELYGVTKTGYKIKLTDSNFKPYFYALPKDVVNQNLYMQKLKSLRVKEGEASIQVLKLEKVRNKSLILVKNWNIIDTTGSIEETFSKIEEILKNIDS